MRRMAEGAWRDFVLAGPRTGKLATVRGDGRPHVVPIWFDLDGDDVVFTTGHGSVKGRALSRDGRVAMCVDDEEPPFAYVALEGEATLSDDPSELRYWAGRIGGRYMGEELADAYGERNGVPGELLVRMRPSRVVAYEAVAE